MNENSRFQRVSVMSLEVMSFLNFLGKLLFPCLPSFLFCLCTHKLMLENSLSHSGKSHGKQTDWFDGGEVSTLHPGVVDEKQ